LVVGVSAANNGAGFWRHTAILAGALGPGCVVRRLLIELLLEEGFLCSYSSTPRPSSLSSQGSSLQTATLTVD
jgi:hypothetical protein